MVKATQMRPLLQLCPATGEVWLHYLDDIKKCFALNDKEINVLLEHKRKQAQMSFSSSLCIRNKYSK